MNFTGQVRRPRTVNLGGRAAAGTNTRQSVLKRAQEDRERRERARREEKAAVAIQKFYRGRRQAIEDRLVGRSEWDNTYLVASSFPTDPTGLAQFLRQYCFFERAPLYNPNDPQCQQRIRLVAQALHNSAGHLDQISNHLLRTLVNSSITTKLALSDPSASPLVLEHLVSIIITLKDYTSADTLQVVANVAKSIPPQHDVPVIWQALDLLSVVHPREFWTTVFTIPQYYKRCQDHSHVWNDSSLVISDDAMDNRSSRDVVVLVDNVLHIIFQSSITMPLLSALNSALHTLAFKYHVRALRRGDLGAGSDALDDAMGDSDNDEEDEEDVLEVGTSLEKLGASQETISAVEELGSRSFTSQLFSLLSTDAAGSNAVLHVVASFYACLIRLSPRTKQSVLLQLSFVQEVSAIHTFWTSFKQSHLYDAGSRNVLSSTQILQSFQNEQPEWTGYLLALELYSYWLIVADDTEFFENHIQGLTIPEVRELAIFLKNLSFSLIWNSSDISASATRSSNKRFLSQITKVKEMSLRVMRQIYTRDSRRPFLGKEFWLMTEHFNMNMFISGVVQEQEKVQNQDDSDDEASNSQPTAAPGFRKYAIRPAEKYKQNVEPRLNILRQAPFFMPFDVRVQIFQEFIANDKSRIAPESFFDEIVNPMRRSLIRVRRGHIFEDAFENVDKIDLKSQLRVEFYNDYGVEAGIDGGGLTKEFLISACAEGFDSSEGLFTTTQNHLLYPEPALGVVSEISKIPSDERALMLAKLNLLGKLVGKCLYEGILVDAEFAPFFLQKLLGIKNSFDDLYTLDPEIYDSLVKLRKYSGDVEDLNLTFSIDQDMGHGKHASLELVRGGDNITVTKANRLEYIHAIANFKLNLVLSPQANAFFSGMSTVISPHWLKMFNAVELQMLISGGHSKIDVNDLRSNTIYGGFTEDDPTVKLFWEVLEEMSEEDRCLLLKFVTSAPKAPLGGFRSLNPKFALRNAGAREVDRLPTASTCVNLLKLPDYRDKEALREKLLYSIRSGTGFDLS